MKLSVVLALVAFVGCQANVRRSEEPEKQLDTVKDAFWDYIFKATKAAQDAMKTITESEFAQQVNDKIKDRVEVAHQYAVILEDQVSVFVRESHPKVSEKVEWLSERLEKDLNAVRAKLEPYTEKLWANIEQQVQNLGQWMAPYTESLDDRGLMRAFLEAMSEMMHTLERTATDLNSLLGPSAQHQQETLEQRLEEFHETVGFWVRILRNEISQKFDNLERSLRPYQNDLRKKLVPYTQELESKLDSLWEAFTKSA